MYGASYESDLRRAERASGAVRYEMLKMKDMERRMEKSFRCGMCANYVESPFNEGYGICVIDDADGRVSQIEFTEEGTRCFTGKFERGDDDD